MAGESEVLVVFRLPILVELIDAAIERGEIVRRLEVLHAVVVGVHKVLRELVEIILGDGIFGDLGHGLTNVVGIRGSGGRIVAVVILADLGGLGVGADRAGIRVRVGANGASSGVGRGADATG